ncbi:hypothetical protein JAAARDRAFT_210734 [Jaapia argillacea MUCL 33604]|uniref:Uncharacterized protein n=1 Tax=Jaapia argillacea MUCL 33604 TaxID=933084 RepID=A0A067PB80_9AGAM|nr:hypothetical protein JAAARDRAFT_210734 [Jaapia argillacea MUCL 33604]
MRLVNRSISSVTRSRAVWIRSVLQMCSKYGIMPSMFLVGSMGLPLLEHIASSPIRFVTRLRRGLQERLTLVHEFSERRILSPLPLSSSDRNTGGLAALRLVPGGRFMVTATRDGSIELWDLGYDPTSLISQTAIASAKIEQVHFAHDVVQLFCPPSHEPTGVHVLIVSEVRGVNPRTTFYIYLLRISPSGPSFHLVATFVHPVFLVIHSVAFSRDAVALGGDGCFILWNFSNNTAAVIVVSQQVDMITFHEAEDEVVTLDCSRRFIAAYRYPTLYPTHSSLSRQLQETRPTRCLPLDISTEWVVAPSPGQVMGSNHEPWYMSILEDGISPTSGYIMYHLRGEAFHKPPPSLARIVLLPSQPPTYPLIASPLASDVKFRSFMALGGTGDCHVLVSLLENAESAPICLWRYNSSYIPYDYCPLSGRMCLETYPNISILDFLCAPPK